MLNSLPEVHPSPLLANDEPPPWQIENRNGRSPYLFLCDHAGNRIPRALHTLGLDEDALQRHIAWDIGAAALAGRLAASLDATAILQPYSRLVIDCNRPPDSPDSIVAVSEQTAIPGNQSLQADMAAMRRRSIFDPYHARIVEHLDLRQRRSQPTLLVALHSFTPVYLGESRRWHAAVLYHRDARMAQRLACELRLETDLVIGENEPYSVSDETDYAIPRYGEARGLPHVELEIRQDLIRESEGQVAWAERLARMLLRIQGTLLSL